MRLRATGLPVQSLGGREVGKANWCQVSTFLLLSFCLENLHGAQRRFCFWFQPIRGHLDAFTSLFSHRVDSSCSWCRELGSLADPQCRGNVGNAQPCAFQWRRQWAREATQAAKHLEGPDTGLGGSQGMLPGGGGTDWRERFSSGREPRTQNWPCWFGMAHNTDFFLSVCVAISVYVCGNATKKNYDHHKCYWFLKEIIIWFHFWEAVICSHSSVICSVTHLLSSKHLYSSQLFEFVWGKMENHPSFWGFPTVSECYFG